MRAMHLLHDIAFFAIERLINDSGIPYKLPVVFCIIGNFAFIASIIFTGRGGHNHMNRTGLT